MRGLALLKTDVTSPAEVAFATRRHLRTGESLTVAGYPTRKLPPLSPQITRATHTGAFASGTLIALKVTVAPGSSDGPALDVAGSLGGVIKAEISTPAVYERTGRVIRDVALAISAGETEQFLRTQGLTVTQWADSTPLKPAALTAFAKQIVARISSAGIKHADWWAPLEPGFGERSIRQLSEDQVW